MGGRRHLFSFGISVARYPFRFHFDSCVILDVPVFSAGRAYARFVLLASTKSATIESTIFSIQSTFRRFKSLETTIDRIFRRSGCVSLAKGRIQHEFIKAFRPACAGTLLNRALDQFHPCLLAARSKRVIGRCALALEEQRIYCHARGAGCNILMHYKHSFACAGEDYTKYYALILQISRVC